MTKDDVGDLWFVRERSEALASLLLTSQDHDELVFQRRSADGVADFIVGLNSQVSPPSQLLAVAVKGTVSADSADWVRSVSPMFRDGSTPHLPSCVVVVNIRDNSAWYAWIAEPTVEQVRAVLKVQTSPKFHPFDEGEVAMVVAQVRAYYTTLPKQLVSTA